MTIVAILIALAVLYWLGSLAYAYFANSTERTRLNNQPGLLVIALLAALSLAVEAFQLVDNLVAIGLTSFDYKLFVSGQEFAMVFGSITPAKCIATVVLPTPPFMFITVRTLPIPFAF